MRYIPFVELPTVAEPSFVAVVAVVAEVAVLAELTFAFAMSVISAIVWVWADGVNVPGLPVTPLHGTLEAEPAVYSM